MADRYASFCCLADFGDETGDSLLGEGQFRVLVQAVADIRQESLRVAEVSEAAEACVAIGHDQAASRGVPGRAARCFGVSLSPRSQ